MQRNIEKGIEGHKKHRGKREEEKSQENTI